MARAFVNHPPLLLADEPTGNLDPETSIGIMQLIYRINRTGTTVIVAHDKEMVDKMRRRVIELREGRIVRDELSGLYRPDESTTEFAVRLRGELGIGAEGPSQLAHALELLPGEAPAGSAGARRRRSRRCSRSSSRPSCSACSSRSSRPRPAPRTSEEPRGRGRLHQGHRDVLRAGRPAQGDRGHGEREVGRVHLEAGGARARRGQEPEAFQEGAELLGSNPLPASFRVTPEDPTSSTRSSSG